jgi:predicted methyltransferase MtxX (methanogen marker protein 4)
MASALRRAEEKVLVALLKLDVLGKELDALDAKPRRDAADEQLRQKKLQRFAAVREEAKTAVWELKVHREALGFRRNEELARLYPIPSARS